MDVIRWKTPLATIAFFLLCGGAAAADRVVLQLRWDHQFQFAGYYAAQWQGYYADAGLDVEIRPAPLPDGAIRSATSEVAAGRADFGIGSGDILLERDKGVQLVILAAIFQQSPVAFYALPSANLSAPADLLKLRVARWPGDMPDVEFQAMLRAEGIDPRQVSGYSYKQGIADLHAGKVDVVPGYIIEAPWQARQLDLAVTALRPASYGVDFYGDTLFTHQRVIDRSPDLVRRFMQSSLAGWEYALTHADEIAARIARDLPRTFATNDAAGLNRFQVNGVRQMILFPMIELGHINPGRWQHMHQTMRQAGLVDRNFDPGTIFAPQDQRQRDIDRLQRIAKWTSAGLMLAIAIFLAVGTAMRFIIAARTAALGRSEQALRAAKEEAERANLAKSRFLAAASHDLRQPFQAMRLLHHLLINRVTDEVTADIAVRLGESIDAGAQLLNTLMDISTLDAGTVQAKPAGFRLNEVLVRLAREFEPQAATRHLIFRTVSCTSIVHSDPVLLERMLRNLLANALRHTERGKILIGCRHQPDGVRIEVWDTGPGIPADQQDAIFEDFYQIGNPGRNRSQGLGLGLAVVRRMSQLLDHPVAVRSRPGWGSCFSITVPLASEAVPTAGADAPGGRTAMGHHILVIEDEDTQRASLALMLQSWGHMLRTAPDAESALDGLRRKPMVPTLVVTDLRLPSVHRGSDIAGLLAREFGRNIACIIITGNGDPSCLHDARRSGCRVQPKPFRPEELATLIDAAWPVAATS